VHHWCEYEHQIEYLGALMWSLVLWRSDRLAQWLRCGLLCGAAVGWHNSSDVDCSAVAGRNDGHNAVKKTEGVVVQSSIYIVTSFCFITVSLYIHDTNLDVADNINQCTLCFFCIF